jgi:hypothetical protein
MSIRLYTRLINTYAHEAKVTRSILFIPSTSSKHLFPYGSVRGYDKTEHRRVETACSSNGIEEDSHHRWPGSGAPRPISKNSVGVAALVIGLCSCEELAPPEDSKRSFE